MDCPGITEIIKLGHPNTAVDKLFSIADKGSESKSHLLNCKDTTDSQLARFPLREKLKVISNDVEQTYLRAGLSQNLWRLAPARQRTAGSLF